MTVRLHGKTHRMAGRSPASLLLLAGVLAQVVPSALGASYSRAERDEAVNAVTEACADALKAANDLEGAVNEIKAQVGKMEKTEADMEKIRREAVAMYVDFDEKIRGGSATAEEIQEHRKAKDDIARRHDELDAVFDGAREAFKAARAKVLGADGEPGAKARYEAARDAARQRCWIKGEKCPDATAVFTDQIVNGLMVAVSERLTTFDAERGKAEDWIEKSDKEGKKFLKAMGEIEKILNTSPPLPWEGGEGKPQPLPTYTVQFLDFDGTEIPGFSYKIEGGENKALVKPRRVPERKWHKFLHWSADRRGDSGEYDGWGKDQFGKGSLAGETSLSLFAIWEEIPVFARFYSGISADGAPTGVISELKLYRTKEEKLPAPAPENLGQTRWGHDFAGWAEALPGKGLSSNLYVFGKAITNDVALCPVWKERPMPVTRHDFSGGKAAPFGKAVELRLSDKLPSDLPSAEGYEYVGWGLSTNAIATPATLVPVRADATLGDCLEAPAEALDLYAIRRPVPRKAVFRGLGDAIVATAWGSVEEAVVPPAAPELPGRVFKGWFAGKADKPYEPCPLKADIELAARYEAVEYSATFVLGPDTNVIVAYSVDAPLVPPPAPERDGWTFKSWSREPGRVVPPVFASVVATNATFYAIGEPEMIPYEFRNWGSIIAKGKVAYGEKLSPPKLVDAQTGKPVAPRGWGWRSNAAPEEFFKFDEPVRRPPRGLLRLCAVWPEELWDNPPRVSGAPEKKAPSGGAGKAE